MPDPLRRNANKPPTRIWRRK